MITGPHFPVKISVILGCLLMLTCSPHLESSAEYSTQIFDSGESQLINEGSESDPMRIYTLDRKQDSILLRTMSTRVDLPSKDSLLAKFTSRLYHTVTDSAHLGVGIAAPQVGILKNIIWVQRFDKQGFPFEVYYNPKILKYSKLRQDCLEGCLSIPNRMDTTRTRSYAILLEHQELSGEVKLEMVEDFTAVIFQHEIDHLNGILYTDHLEAESK